MNKQKFVRRATKLLRRLRPYLEIEKERSISFSNVEVNFIPFILLPGRTP